MAIIIILRRLGLAAVAGLGLLTALGPTPVTLAAWSALGSGSGAAAATAMPTGATPSATVSRNLVTVTWPAVTMASGAAVAGYTINRYNAVNGSPATVGAGCSGVISTTSCTELSVPAGSWIYTDTPVEANWTGSHSADSAAVTVA